MKGPASHRWLSRGRHVGRLSSCPVLPTAESPASPELEETKEAVRALWRPLGRAVMARPSREPGLREVRCLAQGSTALNRRSRGPGGIGSFWGHPGVHGPPSWTESLTRVLPASLLSGVPSAVAQSPLHITPLALTLSPTQCSWCHRPPPHPPRLCGPLSER